MSLRKANAFFERLVDGSTVLARSAIGRDPTGNWKEATISVSRNGDVAQFGGYYFFHVGGVSGADYDIGDFCSSTVSGDTEIGTFMAEDHIIEVKIPV